MTEKRKNKHFGSSFDAYLVEERLYEEATSVAWKRVLSWEVSEAMKKDSAAAVGKRMTISFADAPSSQTEQAVRSRASYSPDLEE